MNILLNAMLIWSNISMILLIFYVSKLTEMYRYAGRR